MSDACRLVDAIAGMTFKEGEIEEVTQLNVLLFPFVFLFCHSNSIVTGVCHVQRFRTREWRLLSHALQVNTMVLNDTKVEFEWKLAIVSDS